jgi:hypothetical protein
VEHLKGSSIGQAPVLPTNVRLGWKRLPGTNALAYYKKFVDYGSKKYCGPGPGGHKTNENINKPLFMPLERREFFKK